MFDIPPYNMSSEGKPNKWQGVHRWLFALNTFLCGFLVGFCIFWFAVEQGHYRPKSAEAKNQFLQQPK